MGQPQELRPQGRCGRRQSAVRQGWRPRQSDDQVSWRAAAQRHAPQHDRSRERAGSEGPWQRSPAVFGRAHADGKPEGSVRGLHTAPPPHRAGAVEGAAPEGGASSPARRRGGENGGGADKADHRKDFVAGCREQTIAPPVACKDGVRVPGLDGRTTAKASYRVSQRIRKEVEQIVGWIKPAGGLRRSRYRGRERTQPGGYLAAGTCNLLRRARLSLGGARWKRPPPKRAQERQCGGRACCRRRHERGAIRSGSHLTRRKPMIGTRPPEISPIFQQPASERGRIFKSLEWHLQRAMVRSFEPCGQRSQARHEA